MFTISSLGDIGGEGFSCSIRDNIARSCFDTTGTFLKMDNQKSFNSQVTKYFSADLLLARVGIPYIQYVLVRPGSCCSRMGKVGKISFPPTTALHRLDGTHTPSSMFCISYGSASNKQSNLTWTIEIRSLSWSQEKFIRKHLGHLLVTI